MRRPELQDRVAACHGLAKLPQFELGCCQVRLHHHIHFIRALFDLLLRECTLNVLFADWKDVSHVFRYAVVDKRLGFAVLFYRGLVALGLQTTP